MDNQLMLIIGNLEISWFAVFTAVACFVGVCIACLLRFVQKRDINDIFTCVAFGIPLGLVFGRILYIIFSGSSLSGLGQYLNLTNGGFGLYGVFLGVFLGAVIAVKYFYADNLGSLLDCIALGGAFAITVGRFATGFTPAEIGYEVDFKLFAVFDSEQGIYNLAVYQLDGVYEAAVFFICLWFFIHCKRHGDREIISGKTALLMLALHGTNQVVMDSMRADPLKLGLNEFIKISQIIGILCCVSVLVGLMIVTAKRYGFGKFHWLSIPLIIVSVILGVFGEYRVGSSNYISNHLIMFAGMVILDWLTIEFALKAAGFNEEFCVSSANEPDAITTAINEAILKENIPAEDEDDTETASAEQDENEAGSAAAELHVISVAADEKPVAAPKTETPVISAEVHSPVSAPAAKAETRYTKLKTIPVISVDAPNARQEVQKTAVPSVNGERKTAYEQPATPQTTDEAREKPLGEQELNMDRIMLELEKIDS